MSKLILLNKFLWTLFAFCLVTPEAHAARSMPEGEVVWQGEVVLDEPVRIPPGSRLVIRPGTVVRIGKPSDQIHVRGELQIDGRAESPVRFEAPEGWQGVSFLEAEAGSRITGARFDGADAAISSIATDFTVSESIFTGCKTAVKLLRESSPLIERNRFTNNDMAIDNEMRSAPTIRNNTFIGQRQAAILASHNSRGLISGNRFENNEQGIGLLQPYADRIEHNVFIENRVALYCNQTKNSPMIRMNRFEGNETALVNYAFAYPAIEDNRFIDNGMAIRNDQYGSPLVRHNLFRNNGTAIYNYRKSNPKVEYNVIEGSERAIFCDYSSYPKVRNNNFTNNDVAVELGIYQSADWEKRSGSKQLMQQEAKARQSKNQLLSQAPTRFKDIVNVSDNWWGSVTKTMAQAGEGGNLDIFYDRLDREWVTYEGFGPESYRIDRVVHAPWLDNPVATAGPRKEQ